MKYWLPTTLRSAPSFRGSATLGASFEPVSWNARDTVARHNEDIYVAVGGQDCSVKILLVQ